MRMIYDRFGGDSVFSKKSMISVALGDLLEDPRKLRGQAEMALSSGVGYVYLDQIRSVGRPDAAFRSRAERVLVDEAGLSDKVAAELMGYFDEMIGWAAAAQSRFVTESAVRGPSSDVQNGLKRTLTLEHTYANGILELRWKEELKEFTIEIKGKTEAAGSGRSVRIPIDPGCSAFIKLEGVGSDGAGVRGTCLYSSEAQPQPGFNPGIPLPTVPVPEQPKRGYYQQMICTYKNGVLDLRWSGELKNFAMAVNSVWIATGSGDRIRIPMEMPVSALITVSEITENGVAFYAYAHFLNMKRAR